MSSINLQTAADAFIRAYAHMQADLPDSQLRQAGTLPWLHFGRAAGDALDEFFVLDDAPEQSAALIQQVLPGKKHWLSVISDNPNPIGHRFTALGYSLDRVEYLMSRGLTDLPALPAQFELRHVRTAALAEIINRARQQELIRPAQLKDPELRYYAIYDEGLPVCWGSLLAIDSEIAYISGMFTVPLYRRRGLAQLLVSGLLVEAYHLGLAASVLVSSLAGHGVYREIGYRDLGEVRVYLAQHNCPVCGKPERESQCSYCGRLGFVGSCADESPGRARLRSNGSLDVCTTCAWRIGL